MITRIEAKTKPATDQVVVTKFINRTGIGNQFFEYSAGLGIARRLNLPFQWVWTDNDKREFGLTHFGIAKPEWWDVPVMCHSLGQGNAAIVKRVCERFMESEDKFLGVCSPFQAEECFANVADEVRELFKLEPLELEVPAGRVPVGVQVRRGDYVKHKRLDVVTPYYFMSAMKFLRKKLGNPHFFIISDDPSWCSKRFGYLSDVTVMPPQEPIDGLRTMAACDAHIISNSTYGWWGAWLAEKGPVVAPRPWHREGSYGEWNPVPKRWIQIPVECPVMAKELPPPGIPKAIVWPWNDRQAKWQELRYSMRSVDRFFEDKTCPIFIVGTRRPPWLLPNKRVTFIEAYLYQDALARGVQCADKVLWMNDDIVLLQPVGWDEVSVPLYLRHVQENFLSQLDQPKDNLWQAGMLRALADLAPKCELPLIYSTHTPYVYERERALEIFREFGIYHKMPLEMIYFNLFAEKPEQIGTRRTHDLPFGDALYLNHTDAKLTAELKAAIKDLLPDFAPWELKAKFTA